MGRQVGKKAAKRGKSTKAAIDALQLDDFRGQIAAIAKAQAVIEFELDGTIRGANELFLRTVGYALDEIKGKHHSLFVEPGYRDSGDYRAFWAKLGRGAYDAGQYRRIGKGGREIWLQASHNPILDRNGRPFQVAEYAARITAQKLLAVSSRRIKTALDNVSGNVMMADAENRIIYLNQSVQNMFRNIALELRRELPNFDPNKLMGSNVDVFHKHSADQQRLLAELRGTLRAGASARWSNGSIGPRKSRSSRRWPRSLQRRSPETCSSAFAPTISRTSSRSWLMVSTACSTTCCRSSNRSRQLPRRFKVERRRSPRATRTCRSGPRRPPRAWSRPHRRWSR